MEKIFKAALLNEIFIGSPKKNHIKALGTILLLWRHCLKNECNNAY